MTLLWWLFDCAVIGWAPSHLGRLDFVSRAAAPTFKIRQHLTLLALHTRLHLTPPLLCYYRSCADREKNRKKRESQHSAHSVGTAKTGKKHAQITTHPRFWRMQQWRLRGGENLRRSRSRPLSKKWNYVCISSPANNEASQGGGLWFKADGLNPSIRCGLDAHCMSFGIKFFLHVKMTRVAVWGLAQCWGLRGIEKQKEDIVKLEASTFNMGQRGRSYKLFKIAGYQNQSLWI